MNTIKTKKLGLIVVTEVSALLSYHFHSFGFLSVVEENLWLSNQIVLDFDNLNKTKI